MAFVKDNIWGSDVDFEGGHRLYLRGRAGPRERPAPPAFSRACLSRTKRDAPPQGELMMHVVLFDHHRVMPRDVLLKLLCLWLMENQREEKQVGF